MLADSREYLRHELNRLDLLLHRQILRLRASYQLSLDEFRGLYVSDQQVDNLVTKISSEDDQVPNTDSLTFKAEQLHRLNVAQLRSDSTWKQLVDEFGLAPFEEDVVLLAVAPDFDLKYETLFAYLNNDVTRKLPTFDLALRLFGRDDRTRVDLRKYFLPDATLFRDGLLRVNSGTHERSTWLATSFSLTPAVSEFLLSIELARDWNPPATTWADVPATESLRDELKKVTRLFTSDRANQLPIIVFEGERGAGKQLAAEAICRELKLPLTSFDLAAHQTGNEQLQRQLDASVLHQRLRRSALYLYNPDALFDKEGNPLHEATGIFNRFDNSSLPVFVACAPSTQWRTLLNGRKSLHFEFTDLQFAERFSWWIACSRTLGWSIDEATAELLAGRFVLSGGQIKSAVASAIDLKQFQEDDSRTLPAHDLIA